MSPPIRTDSSPEFEPHSPIQVQSVHGSALTHILSRLPTKDAFRTCILSKDWEYKWTSSYNVDIDDCWWLQRYTRSFSEESFVNVMDRIVISPHHALRSFRLKCQKYWDSSRLQTWLSAVLRREVESFILHFRKKGFTLPTDLLNTTSLTTLKLWHWEGILNVPTETCLPNLTTLFLEGVHIVNENANARTMTLNFPVLETLALRECKWLNVESVEIYAPSLTTVISEPMNMDKEYDYSVTILAPRLTTFVCSFGLPEKFILNGSSIVSALLRSDGDGLSDNIQLLANIGSRFRNLLNTCTSLEELELSGFMANVSQLGPPLRLLGKLKRLTLLHPSNAEQLFELLHAAPSLKYLSINLHEWDDSHRGAMETMPSCIVSNLEEVEIRGFYHLEPECTTAQYDLLKLFLKNAEHLKKFWVAGYAPYHKPEELGEILSAFPKCSPYLTIEVVRQGRISSIPDRFFVPEFKFV